MTKEQLTFCDKCKNCELDLIHGLKCSLTGEKPTFYDHCPDFLMDELESKKIANKVESSEEVNAGGFWGSWKAALLFSAFGFIRAAIKGFDDVFGIIFFISGIVWLIIALLGNANSNE